MTIGAAALLRVVGAFFQLFSDLFTTGADFCVAAGNPELSTPCALLVVGLACSGHYLKALLALLSLTLLDLVGKELGLGGLSELL